MIADSLTLSATYRFISRAKNVIGYSEFSAEAFIAFGSTPNTPDAPTMVTSTRTSITMAWTEPAPADGDLTTTGYILNMDDGYITELLPVYIGTNQIDVFEFTVGGLTNGLPYRFTVQAVNENGLSEQSSISTYYSCAIPDNLSFPSYVRSDQVAKTITI